MIASFVTQESKNVVTNAGTFRVTRRVNILDGDVHYVAYEPLSFMGSHYSFKWDDERWWGNVSQRMLPGELDKHFEGRPERRAAVASFYKANRDLARALIEKAFPEATQGLRIMGAIVLSFSKLPDSARAQMHRNAFQT